MLQGPFQRVHALSSLLAFFAAFVDSRLFERMCMGSIEYTYGVHVQITQPEEEGDNGPHPHPIVSGTEDVQKIHHVQRDTLVS
jgi:hypothetical protein